MTHIADIIFILKQKSKRCREIKRRKIIYPVDNREITLKRHRNQGRNEILPGQMQGRPYTRTCTCNPESHSPFYSVI